LAGTGDKLTDTRKNEHAEINSTGALWHRRLCRTVFARIIGGCSLVPARRRCCFRFLHRELLCLVGRAKKWW